MLFPTKLGDFRFAFQVKISMLAFKSNKDSNQSHLWGAAQYNNTHFTLTNGVLKGNGALCWCEPME